MDQPHREPVEEFNSYRCVTSCVHSFIRFDFKYCLLYVFYLIWDWIQGRGQANHPSEESIQFVMTAINNMIFNTMTAKWSSLSLSEDMGRQGTSPQYHIRYLDIIVSYYLPNSTKSSTNSETAMLSRPGIWSQSKSCFVLAWTGTHLAPDQNDKHDQHQHINYKQMATVITWKKKWTTAMSLSKALYLLSPSFS